MSDVKSRVLPLLMQNAEFMRYADADSHRSSAPTASVVQVLLSE